MNRGPHGGQGAGHGRMTTRQIQRREIGLLLLQVRPVDGVHLALPLLHRLQRPLGIAATPLGQRAVGQQSRGGRCQHGPRHAGRQLVEPIGADVGAVSQQQLCEDGVRLDRHGIGHDERRQKLRLGEGILPRVHPEEPGRRSRGAAVRRVERHGLREPRRKAVDVAGSIQQHGKVVGQPRRHRRPQRRAVRL